MKRKNSPPLSDARRARLSHTTGWCVGLAVMLLAPAAAQAEIIVNVTHVGFLSNTSHVVRQGSWAPILVNISLEGDNAFDGMLRVGQFDGDGDLFYDEQPVHLRADEGTGSRDYTLYTLPNLSANPSEITIELLDENGDNITFISQGVETSKAELPGPLRVLSEDEVMILNVSMTPLGDISKLDGNLIDHFAKVVTHTSPLEMPQQWIGLEMVDYIVWDGADPTDMNARQLAALIDWLKQGGTLLVAAGKTSDNIRLSGELYKLLPVDVLEGAGTNPDLEDFHRNRLVGNGRLYDRNQAEMEAAAKDIVFARCRAREDALVLFWTRGNSGPAASGEQQPLVAERHVGRGRLIFSAVTMRDLFRKGSALGFYRSLFGFIPVGERLAPDRVTLFGRIVSYINFTTRGSLYLMVGVLFSLTYIGVATFGTWGFLGAKNLRKHCWTAFALVALIGSFLSFGAVRVVRGGRTMHQLAILDLEAGNSFGYGNVYFGLKSASDRRFDLWVPSNPITEKEPTRSTCFLRPLPVSADPNRVEDGFVDPVRYHLSPTEARMEDVRLRSTLKRFEAGWEGLAGGQLTADIKVRRSSSRGFYRLTQDSVITNELGVDLYNCWLLSPQQTGFLIEEYGEDDVLAFELGQLPAGKPVHPARIIYDRSGQRKADEPLNDATYFRNYNKLALKQKSWRGGIGDLFELVSSQQGDGSKVDAQESLLMLSTLSFSRDIADRFGSGSRNFSRDRMRFLDLSQQLRPDCVYLIGFANAPGPVRMTYDGWGGYRVIEPSDSKSMTMFRIRIPVKRPPDQPPDRKKEEDKEHS